MPPLGQAPPRRRRPAQQPHHNEFLQLAKHRGVYCSEEAAGFIVAHWVNRQFNYMRRDNLPLGMRLTNEQKADGAKNSRISRGNNAIDLAYRAHILDRAGDSREQILKIIDRSERRIRDYLATPFAVIKEKRRAAKASQGQGKAKPCRAAKPSYAIAAAIYYLLVVPSTEIPSENEQTPPSKLPNHTEIDVIAELKTHWKATKGTIRTISPSRAPNKDHPQHQIE